MDRKKVILPLPLIAKDSTRRAIFVKHRKTLMERARKLAGRCGVDACVVASGAGESRREVWPEDPREAELVLARFKDVPEPDRRKKMMSMDALLRKRTDKMEELLRKARRENRETETALLLHDAIAGRRPGLAGLSVDEVVAVGWMVESHIVAVRHAIERLQSKEQDVPAAPALHLPMPYQPLDDMIKAPRGHWRAGLRQCDFAGAMPPLFGDMGFGFTWPDDEGH